MQYGTETAFVLTFPLGGGNGEQELSLDVSDKCHVPNRPLIEKQGGNNNNIDTWPRQVLQARKRPAMISLTSKTKVRSSDGSGLHTRE